MKDKIVIFGTSIFSRDLYKIIKNEGVLEVVAFTQESAYINNESQIEGLPLIPFDFIDEIYPPSEVQILNTIGYSSMNDLREKIFYLISSKGYNNYTYISNRAILDSFDIGEGSIIAPLAYVGPSVTIGKSNIIGSFVSLTHRINIGDFNQFSDGVSLGGKVNVANHCFIGLKSVINNGVFIAPYTFVGAATYVSNSTEENCAYLGNPIRKLPQPSKRVVRFVGIFD